MTYKRTANLLMSALLLMSACTGSGTDKPKITLQLFGDGEELAAYKELIAEFHKQERSFEVRLIAVPNSKDHMARLTSSFAGGDPPDLFLLNYRRVGQFATKGAIHPIGPLLDSSSSIQRSDFFDQALEAFTFEGDLVCLPQNISSLVVYFNKKLFTQASVEFPKRGWTWQDFLEASKAMTKDIDADGTMDVHGLGIEPTLVRLSPFVWQNEGKVVDDTSRPTAIALSGRREVEALQFFTDLGEPHRVTPSLEEARSQSLVDRFAAGKLGMLLESRRVTPTLRSAADLDWDVGPLPKGRVEATVLHSDAYCISKDSDNKSQAFRFIEYALHGEGASIIARSGRTVPSNRKVADTQAFLAPNQRPASSRLFLEMIPTIQRLPNSAFWNEVEVRSDPIVEEWFYNRELPELLGLEIRTATQDLFPKKQPATPSP